MKVVVNRTKKRIISMRVDEEGVLQVTANSKLSLQKVKDFVESKRDWVTRQIAAKTHIDVERDTDCAVITSASESVGGADNDIAEMFAGKKCLLCGDLFKVKPTVESKCYLDGDSIYIPEKFYANKDTRLKALKTYIKKMTVQNVSDEISKFGCNASLCPKRIEFKNIQNGWVKCTQPYEKVITLDYRISQLSAKLQNYLIVHAFSHFTNEGHDDAFWNTVSNYLPRYKSCVEELKRYDFLKDIE